MGHLFYEEEQRLSQVGWIWVAMLLLLLAPLAMIVSGNETPSQQEMTSILLSTAFAFIPMVGIIFFSRLQFKIDGEGIHYKFFPAVIKWRVIPKSFIESFEVTEKRNLIEKLTFGYRRNRLNNCITMNISGSKFARLKLKDGRQLKIGSENPESMEQALRKLTSPDNN
jgi:hypothetical protein